MSFTAIRWALSQDSLEDPREALLLVVLADYHNDKTGQCNPSRDTLKKRARIGNNNTLTAKLSTLQKKGLITVYSQNGKSNCYRLKLESTLETESPPSSELNHLPSSELNQVQNCTRFRTEPPPSSELNHLPSSELNHEPISEPIKEPINTSFVRRADPGSPDAQKDAVNESEKFNLTEPKEELTPKQRSAQIGSHCPHEKIIALYHECLPMLPTVRIWSEDRRKTLAARWRTLVNDKGYQSEEEGLGWFKRLFGYIRRSRFLTGETPQKEGHTWRPDLEWIIKPKNLTKIIEGKYHVK
jgi:hypothetical protein